MLRQYVNPFHTDWDEHLDMAEFAINDAWQESVQETPFMSNYGQHPLNFLSLQTYSQVPAAADFTENMRLGIEHAQDCLERAQQRQKTYTDPGSRDVNYDVGADLMLNTKNVRYRSPGTPKLMPRWVGPYKVLERVGKVAYHLALPVELKMHPVFHVPLLKPVKQDQRLQPPPPRVLLNGDVVYTIDRILDHRKTRKGKRKSLKEFLIRWEGFDSTHDSWEPEALIHDPWMVQDYWDSLAASEQHTVQQTKPIN